MANFWYPEIHTRLPNGKPDKKYLFQSYIRYFLSRLQSMFIYEGLPDTVPQKYLENYLLTHGSCVWFRSVNGNVYVVDGEVGGDPDVYYIPREIIITNPYLPNEDNSPNRKYIRDKNAVLMLSDSYSQGLLPLIEKYVNLLCETETSIGVAAIVSRASLILSAVDDNTKKSIELWLKRLLDGDIGIISEGKLLVGNQDRAFSVNSITGADTTITNLIELEQYLKASLFNELGLQSNYNMKRESINSGEAQLTEDQLHPLIDNMLDERKKALEKVNEMFGLNVSVKFNSAWNINEREEQAAINNLENQNEDFENQNEDFENQNEDFEEQPVEEQPTEEQATEEQPVEEQPTEVTLTEETIEEIADEVIERIEEEGDDDVEKDK